MERDVDRMIVLPASKLKNEVTGYRIANAGNIRDFPKDQLIALVFYPDRDTFTFCCKGGDGSINYSTYARSKITQLTTTSGYQPPVFGESLLAAQSRAVEEALRIIQSKP